MPYHFFEGFRCTADSSFTEHQEISALEALAFPAKKDDVLGLCPVVLKAQLGHSRVVIENVVRVD